MLWHDNECVEEEFPLAAIVEQGSLQQLRRARDLKDAATFGCYSRHQVGASFLGREAHRNSIIEMPVAKATLFSGRIQGPKGPCSLRRLDPLPPKFLDLRLLRRGHTSVAEK